MCPTDAGQDSAVFSRILELHSESHCLQRLGSASIDIPFPVEDTEPRFLDEFIAAFSRRGLEFGTEFSQPIPFRRVHR